MVAHPVWLCSIIDNSMNNLPLFLPNGNRSSARVLQAGEPRSPEPTTTHRGRHPRLQKKSDPGTVRTGFPSFFEIVITS